MPYNNDSVMRSETAYKVFRELAEENLCSGDLKESISSIKSASSLRNLLGKMNKANIIEQVPTPENEDSRKKFYTANFEGLFNLWVNSLRTEVDGVLEGRNLSFNPEDFEDVDYKITEFNPKVSKDANIHRSQLNIEQKFKSDDLFSVTKSFEVFKYAYSSKNKLKPFFLDYVKEYVKNNEESTLHEMTTKDLRTGLTFTDYSSDTGDYELTNLLILLNFVTGTSKGIRAVDIALKRYE